VDKVAGSPLHVILIRINLNKMIMKTLRNLIIVLMSLAVMPACQEDDLPVPTELVTPPDSPGPDSLEVISCFGGSDWPDTEGSEQEDDNDDGKG